MAPAGPSFLLQAELDHRILLSDPKSHSVLTSSSCYWSIKTHARAVIELLTRLSIKHLYIANKRDFPFISLRSWTNTLTTPVLSFFFFFLVREFLLNYKFCSLIPSGVFLVTAWPGLWIFSLALDPSSFFYIFSGFFSTFEWILPIVQKKRWFSTISLDFT